MKLLIISRWDEHYENAGSRKCPKLYGVLLTNSFESERYLELLNQPNPAPLLAAFVLMLQVASTCTPRGALLRDNGAPHDAHSLAVKTRAPAAWFKRAIPYLCGNGNAHEPGWLREVEIENPSQLGEMGCFSAHKNPTKVAETPPRKPQASGENTPASVVLDSLVFNSLSPDGERVHGTGTAKTATAPPSRADDDAALRALADVCGHDAGKLTADARTSLVRAMAQIQAVTPGLAPTELAAEIRRRARRYGEVHPTWGHFGPPGFAKYWPELDGKSNDRRTAARRTPGAPIRPPPNLVGAAPAADGGAAFTEIMRTSGSRDLAAAVS